MQVTWNSLEYVQTEKVEEELCNQAWMAEIYSIRKKKSSIIT